MRWSLVLAGTVARFHLSANRAERAALHLWLGTMHLAAAVAAAETRMAAQAVDMAEALAVAQDHLGQSHTLTQFLTSPEVTEGLRLTGRAVALTRQAESVRAVVADRLVAVT